MKLRLLTIMFVGLMWLVPQTTSAIGNPNDFEIDSFTADYYLTRDANENSKLAVNEEITAIFPQIDQNHGILRAIPMTYQKNSLNLKVISITDENGSNYPYTTYKENDNLVLKIGDAGRFVHGKTTYRIQYHMRNVINFADIGQQWYWDINGDQWSQKMNQVTARLHLNVEVASDLGDNPLCFLGKFGETATCEASVSSDSSDTVIVATAKNVLSYQTMTLQVGFAPNTFTQNAWVVFKQKWGIWMQIGLLILPLLLISWWMFKRWQKTGRDPKGQAAIVTQFLAPKDISVLMSDLVYNEKIAPKAYTAGLLSLATRGFIKIYEDKQSGFLTKAEYSIELAKDVASLPQNDRDLLDLFFVDGLNIGNKVELKALKNLVVKTMQLRVKLADQATKEGYFVVNPIKIKTKYYMFGGGLFVGGFVIFILLTKLGFFWPVSIGTMASGVIVYIFGALMPARTVKGVLMRDYLRGLKEFIRMAEMDRLKYLQSPEGVKQYGDPNDSKTPLHLFEKLLPYAVLFGLEKEWAEQFASLYQEPPSWYSGNYAAFSTSAFVGSIHSFNSAVSTSFAPPTSSGSGGGSGGFSGGGGGGGGGGGW